MNKLVFILITLFISNNVDSQNLLANVSKEVGLISYTSKPDSKLHWGTGTLIRKDSAFNYGNVYLITNKHVLPTIKENNSIDFKIKKSFNGIDSFEIINIPIFNSKGEYFPYVKFDKQGEDVCAIDFNYFYALHNMHSLDTFLIPYEFLLSKNELSINNVAMGEHVYFIGYPSYFFNSKNISPILRSGIISTNPTEDYYYSNEFLSAVKSKFGESLSKKLNGFLIDGNVFGGSSGSLVIFISKAVSANNGVMQIRTGEDLPYVVGIITQSFFDIGVDYIQRVNIATAISSEVIKRTIDLFQ